MGRKDFELPTRSGAAGCGLAFELCSSLGMGRPSVGGKQHGNIRGSSGCVSQGGWWHNWQTCTPPEAQALWKPAVVWTGILSSRRGLYTLFGVFCMWTKPLRLQCVPIAGAHVPHRWAQFALWLQTTSSHLFLSFPSLIEAVNLC